MRSGSMLRPVLAPVLLVLAACTTTPQRPSDAASALQAASAPPVAHRPASPVPAPATGEPVAKAESEGSDSPVTVAPTVSDLLARLSRRLHEPHCDDPTTQRQLRTLLRHPDALAAKVERVAPMLDYVLTAVERHELPGQFALIPWAESGFRADPGNRGTVQGLWQFTVSTGRAHGLRIDRRYDGRRAAIESTAAAIDHLQRLQQRFGDWRLSLLAYNAGEYRVARGLARGDTTSASLPRNLELHSYVYLGKIAALACLFRDPVGYGIVLSEQPYEPMQVVDRPSGVHSTARLAQAFGIDLEELLLYNAAFRDGDINDQAPMQILLPRSVAQSATLANVDSSARDVPQGAIDAAEQPHSAGGPRRPLQHVVAAGENLWRIARRYGLALKDLLGWNQLSSSSTIRPGQRLRLSPE